MNVYYFIVFLVLHEVKPRQGDSCYDRHSDHHGHLDNRPIWTGNCHLFHFRQSENRGGSLRGPSPVQTFCRAPQVTLSLLENRLNSYPPPDIPGTPNAISSVCPIKLAAWRRRAKTNGLSREERRRRPVSCASGMPVGIIRCQTSSREHILCLTCGYGYYANS